MNKREKLIIEELDKNSKIQYSKLAEKLKVSKQSIYNMVNSLEKRGVILKHIAVIDKYKIGYNNVYLFLKIDTLSSKELLLREIELKKVQGVTSVANFFGDYDLGISVYYESLTNLARSLNKIYAILKGVIEKKMIYFTKANIIQSMAFEENAQRTTFKKEATHNPIKINTLQSKIIELIESNYKMNNISLAEVLKVSPNTIKYNIKKLEKEGVIQGYKIVLDYSSLGYLWNICMLEIFPGKKINNLLEDFKKNKKIPFITVDIENNIHFDYLSEDYSSLKEFLNNLKFKYKNIIRRYTILNVNKLNYLPYNKPASYS